MSVSKAQGLQIQAFAEVSLRQRLIYQICYFTRENQILFVGHISFLKEILVVYYSWENPLFNTGS